MEDTLRVQRGKAYINFVGVLILVLMEDTLREKQSLRSTYTNLSLNPCFNGRYSQSKGRVNK